VIVPRRTFSLSTTAPFSYQTSPGQHPASAPLLERVASLSPCFSYGHSSLGYTRALDLLVGGREQSRETVKVRAAIEGRDGKARTLHSTSAGAAAT